MKQKIFFTSDLHFSHQNILKYNPEHRPFATVEEMDRALIELWNNKVTPNDIVYNLGDLCFAHNAERVKRILNQLNGQYHFILGNHDQALQSIAGDLLRLKKRDGNPYLSSIKHYDEIKVQKQTLILFHYPIAEWNKCHHGSIMLHGHIHDRVADVDGKIINVGFDRFGDLLDLETVLSIAQPLKVKMFD